MATDKTGLFGGKLVRKKRTAPDFVGSVLEASSEYSIPGKNLDGRIPPVLSRIQLWISVMPMIVIAGALILAGCEAPTPASPVTLRMGMYTAQDYLPYFVMQEQGFDKKYGLNITVSPVAGGAAAIDAMVAGTMDMSLAGIVPLLAAAERGLIPSHVLLAQGVAQQP